MKTRGILLRRLFLLIVVLAAVLWLVSCSPATTAAPTAKTQPAVEEPSQPSIPSTSAVAKEDTARPIATQEKPSTPAPTSPNPTSQPAASATPVEASPAPVVEKRLVELEYPPRLRLGDSDIIRLALVPYKEGYIVEAEFPEHQVQSQTVPVERLAGYKLAAAARLDGIGFEIQPTGEQQQFLPAGQPVAWRWTLRARYSGQQRLAVTVMLVWLPEVDNPNPSHQAQLYSKGIDVDVTSFLGMTRGQAAAGGIFGLFFGGGLGMFALVYRGKPRPILLQERVPNPHLVIEKDPGMVINAVDDGLLRAVFQRYARLSLVGEFLSGYSGARTLLALPVLPDGRADAYTIVKMGGRADIEREYQNYESYVRDSLPPMTARIQQAPVGVKTRSSAPGTNRAALRYTFIAAPGHLPLSLRLALLEKPDPALLYRLFDSFGPNWWMQRKPYVFRLGGEYDCLLPPHYVIQPADVDRQALPLLSETLLPGDLRLEIGDQVLVSRFSWMERREDGASLTLRTKPAPGQSSLRLRWLSAEPPNSIPGRSASGRVIATRTSLLHEMTRSFDHFGLPDPLQRLDELLNETIMGTQSTIHGDLNLENILVGPGELVWLIDFAQTRPGHPLFDFARLASEIIAHVTAKTTPSPRIGLDRLEAGDGLLEAVKDIAHKCLFNPSVTREYDLALYCACLGALKFANLDEKQKHLLYLWAAHLSQAL